MAPKLLLAEDHDDNRRIVRRRLEKHGYAVIEARDGAEAVAKARETAPDLIIMDLSMPELDGIEAWRMICDLMETPPPVIALTATVIQDVRLNCAEMGFKAFLTKPVEFQTLVETIEKVRRRAPIAA